MSEANAPEDVFTGMMKANEQVYELSYKATEGGWCAWECKDHHYADSPDFAIIQNGFVWEACGDCIAQVYNEADAEYISRVSPLNMREILMEYTRAVEVARWLAHAIAMRDKDDATHWLDTAYKVVVASGK